MNKKQVRQGDVYLKPADMPAGKGKKIKAERGRLILARGEATGHHHSVSADVAELIDFDGKVALVVKGDRLELYDQNMTVKCAQYGNEPVPLWKAVLAGAVGELLIHQEHTAEVVDPGTYWIIRQREYHPQEIRRVKD